MLGFNQLAVMFVLALCLCKVTMAPKRARPQAPAVACLYPFCMRRHICQVLAQELQELKRRRAESKARSRALAQQEKNMKKRRTRLLQACPLE